MRIPPALLLFLLFSCNHKRSESSKIKPVFPSGTTTQKAGKAIPTDRDTLPNASSRDFPVILKNGYSVMLNQNDSTESLYLRHGGTEKEIASCSKGLPYQNLGYVKADFPNCFVLMHSFGSGNPHYIELIEKRTAVNRLPKGSVWVDGNEPKGFLLYSETPNPSRRDSMTLLNVITGRKYPVKSPPEIIQDPDLLNSIRIYSITNRLLVLSYNAKQGSKRTAIVLR